MMWIELFKDARGVSKHNSVMDPPLKILSITAELPLEGHKMKRTKVNMEL